MPTSLLKGVRTLTANIVLEMGYATGLHREALIASAVVLFVFILIINLSVSLLRRGGNAAINRQTVGDRFRAYLKHPGSLVLFLLVMLAAIVTLCGTRISDSIHTCERCSVSDTVSVFAGIQLRQCISGACGGQHGSDDSDVPSAGRAFWNLRGHLSGGIRQERKQDDQRGACNRRDAFGYPSIVYGLFCMLFFVTALHWEFSMLSGAFTLAIMILPLVMRTTEEALMAVPDSYREGSFGLGAGKLRTVFPHRASQRDSRESGRRDSGHRPYRRRDGGADVHIGNCSRLRGPDGFRTYPGRAYVRADKRGPSCERGFRHSRSSAGYRNRNHALSGFVAKKLRQKTGA